jgi:response regulator RpfG family c-di-GMP phosphodiesterase
MIEKILLVEGAPNPLGKVREELAKRFDLTAVVGYEDALAAVRAAGPFAVVLSDYKMPKKDGLALFAALKQSHPETVRMLQIPYGDMDIAVGAIADDLLFRFVVKPLSAEGLARHLNAGLAQYKLNTAENAFFSETMHGVIQALTDVLSLANPAAFGRAQRIQGLVHRMAKVVNIPKFWEVDMAAMLSHIGCVSLPAEVLDKISTGQDLMGAERKLFESHPTVGAGLLAHIPRMGEVAESIRMQHAIFEEMPPMGARVLKVVLDYDMLSHKGLPSVQIFQRMRGARGVYDQKLLAALESVIPPDNGYVRRLVGVRDLKENMILDDNITTTDGMLLLAKGSELNEANIYRLIESKNSFDIKEPVTVLVPEHTLV